jgi:phosphoribosylformylglycinamidine synthase
MLEGPIGGARFGNEYGRPQLLGLFKTFEERYNGRYRGYHKPIMVAGGMGRIKRTDAHKKEIPAGALIVQIGGPAMRIGLGGGAASSMATGSNVEELDYDSVQRDNAEMQRRCQEVIDGCVAMGADNPILSIHDLGAGGLSNGCPELVADTGGRFDLRKVPSEDASMSPMEIWCCEAQERYVLAVLPGGLPAFLDLCARERCPAAVIGEATGDGRLTLDDAHFGNRPIDVDVGVILGRPPRMVREARRLAERHAPLDLSGITVREAADRVLRLPAVACKTFLVTIADRTIGGLVSRDQMVGPYQAPISDLAVTATSFDSFTGEAMAMGERTAAALVSAPASGRLAVGEALTNLAGAAIGAIGRVKLSANWMCACGEEGEDAALFDTVRAVGMELCPALGVAIPVGKDSLSMRTVWRTSDGRDERMTAPLSLVVSAFAPVLDVRKTVTPDLKPGPSALLLVDLGGGRNRLGCSALARVTNQVGDTPPDLDDPSEFVRFFAAVQELVDRGLLLACHDRSDGGLFVTLAEMCFGGRAGARVALDGLGRDPLAILFSEELGVVLQVADRHAGEAEAVLGRHGLASLSRRIGETTGGDSLDLWLGGQRVFGEGVLPLQRKWAELTWRMQAMRDNPDCAREEYDALLDRADPGMSARAPFAAGPRPSVPPRRRAGRAPRVAILREQGINGQVEMAAAFDRAGFESVDVHMTELIRGAAELDGFAGLVACGGFSYGDVLGAGSGWARCVLFNDALREMFRRFFERPDTFALGVCNGCQMLSQLKEIIPGAGGWPAFRRNRSEQFEARYVSVEVLASPSILLRGMEGAILPVPVAHGEGLADFPPGGAADAPVSLRFVDNAGRPTERYPLNPNGSPGGITGLTTPDGRVTIMMPHPERLFRSAQMSYRPPGMFEGEDGPWMRLFLNAREFAAAGAPAGRPAAPRSPRPGPRR